MGIDRESLKLLLLRVLTKNQVLLLNETENNSTKTVTSLGTQLSNKFNIPLSTLKLNSRILKELNLITFERFQPVKLTTSGKTVLEIIGDIL